MVVRPASPARSAARLASLALLAALAGSAGATNTGDEAALRVTCFDGTVVEGPADLQRAKLDVRAHKRTKLRYRDVAALADLPPADPAAVASEYAERAAKLPADADADAWGRLGRWAREQGLRDQAHEAFAKALALAPEDEAARRGLLQVKGDDGQWTDGPALLLERQRALGPNDADAQVALARWALQNDLDDQAFGLIQAVLNRDTYQVAALELSRPFTARYQQRHALGLPFRGRWRASEDSTRHHQRKAWAAYALDLSMVDEQGKEYHGTGRRLEDWYCYNQPFYAMAAGRVVEIRDGFPDNPVGQVPPEVVEKHNGITIDIGGGELVWYIHAKAGTFTVKEGDQVQRGQELGRVGNSGASGAPHLHTTLVAFRNLSVPWACDDYTLIAPDGTPLPVSHACPREGWTMESKGN